MIQSAGSLTLLLVSALAGPIAAQTITLGVKAGASAAHFVGDPGTHYPVRYTPAVAVDATLRPGRVVGLRVETMLVERGSRGGVSMRLRYVEFPILLRRAVPREFLGVTAAGLVGFARARERSYHLVVWDVGGIPEDPTPPAPSERDCWEKRQTGLDFGLIGGLELEKRLPVGRLNVELRHTRGTRDLVSLYSCCSLVNRTWALLVGYDLALIR